MGLAHISCHPQLKFITRRFWNRRTLAINIRSYSISFWPKDVNLSQQLNTLTPTFLSLKNLGNVKRPKMSNHDGFCVDPKLICLQANTPEFIFSISHALIVIIPLDLKTLKHLLGDVFFSLLSTWKGQRDSGCTSFSSMDVWEPIGSKPWDLVTSTSLGRVSECDEVFTTGSDRCCGGMKFGKVDELLVLGRFWRDPSTSNL